MKNLIEQISDQEIEEEEKIVFAPEFSIENRISYILEKNCDFITGVSGDIDHEASLLLNNTLVNNGSNYLERTTLLASAKQFIEPKPNYLSIDIEGLVKKISVDIYADFFFYLTSNIDSKKKEKEKKKDVEVILIPIIYFKGNRPDLKKISKRISALYKGIEDVIQYANNLNDLRNLAAANIILNFYPDRQTAEEQKKKIISNEANSKEKLVYSIIKYHQAVLNNLR